MKKALIIGLNYKDTDFELPGCENDCRDLSKIISECGVEVVSKNKITRQEVLDFFESAKLMAKTDTLIFCYSGHGTQVPSSEETDNAREALCLWNGGDMELLYDKELKYLVSSLACSVVVYLDSCFSGGMFRSNDNPTMKRFTRFYPDIMKLPEAIYMNDILITKNKQCFLLACQEGEYATDLGSNGAFTMGVKEAWSKGKRTASSIMAVAIRIAKKYQKPKYVAINQKSIKLF